MSGKEQRIDASVLPISLRCWRAGSGQARGRGEAQNRFVRAHDEVCNARARWSLQIQPDVIMLESKCRRSYRTAPVATISGVMVR